MSRGDRGAGQGDRGMPASGPSGEVFIVDDDLSVRESLDTLIRFEGWQPETFASAQDFLSRRPPIVPSCLVAILGVLGCQSMTRACARDR